MDYKIRFGDMEWELPRDGMRAKRICIESSEIRIVEFRPELSHPEWCTNGHVGYVISGELEIRFANQTETYGPGDGIFIPAGQSHKHVPCAKSKRVRLFLYDIREAPPARQHG